MRRLLAQRVSIPLSSLFDPTTLLDKSRIEGAALEAEEIRDVLSLVDDVSAWAALMETPPDALDEEIGELAALSAPLQASNLKPLVESLRGRMLPDGSLADNASPNLGRIRREIERQQRQIEQSLRQTLRRLAEGGGVQDELITIRGERFVIPIKTDAKRRVPGVVHGASSSGQTVYVEPLETIEQNNELVQLFEEEQAEIHRIFLAMTRQIGAQSAVIGAGAAILAVVESLVMRGRFADDFQCIRPALCGGSGRARVAAGLGAASVAGAAIAKGWRRHRSDLDPDDQRGKTADYQRAQHRRQDSWVEDDRVAGNHGPGGDSGASGGGGVSALS